MHTKPPHLVVQSPRSVGRVIAAAAACTAAGRAGATSRCGPCICCLQAGRRHWRASSAIIRLRGEGKNEGALGAHVTGVCPLCLPCSTWLHHIANHKALLAAHINTKAHQVPAQRAAEGGAHPPHLRRTQDRVLAASAGEASVAGAPAHAIARPLSWQAGVLLCSVAHPPRRARTSCSSSGPEGAGASKHLV